MVIHKSGIKDNWYSENESDESRRLHKGNNI